MADPKITTSAAFFATQKIVPPAPRPPVLRSTAAGAVADPDEKIYTHSVLALTSLPRSKPEGDVWSHETALAHLIIRAGDINRGDGVLVKAELPYGAIPRLALAWINTQAIKTNSPEVDIGESAADFLRRLGLDSGGERYKTLRLQMNSLAVCRMTLAYKGDPGTNKVDPIDYLEPWISDESGQRTIWPGRVILKESYYTHLRAHSVPLSYTALQQLTKSSLAIDIYTWLAYRLHALRSNQTLHWHQLKDQLGPEYRESKDFKKKFIPALLKVQEVYPKARVNVVSGGIVISPSDPPISKAAVTINHAPQ